MSVARGKATDFSCVTTKNITMKGANFLEKLLDNQPVEWKKLGEVFITRNGYTPSKSNPEYWEGGTIPWYRMEDIRENGRILSDALQHITPKGVKGNGLFKANSIILATTATIGEHALITTDALCNQQLTNFEIKEDFKDKLLSKFVFYYFYVIDDWCKKNVNVSSFPSVSVPKLKKLDFPIPPLSVQSRIVEILDKFTSLEAELELRKKQYAYYREQLLNFSYTPPSEFNVVYKKLGEVADYEQPTAYLVKDTKYKEDYPTPVLTAGKTFILGYTNETEGIYEASKHPTIIFDDFTTALRWVDFDFKAKSSAMKMITSKDENVCLLKYIYYWLCTVPSEVVVGDHKRQWISNYANKDFPLPPLSEQERIVEILDKFDTLTNSISEGLPLEIQLRRHQYEYYREQLLDFRRF